MGLLRTIVFIVLIYYVLKIIGRYALPFFIKRFMGKMEDKMKQQQQGFEKKEEVNIGETVIDKKPKNNTSNKNVGEYIDYEEVE